MTVAVVALIVALGGTSYAVTRLPANSVGTAQLKSNAVVASKVKDGSLLKRDFAVGQLPAGRQGRRAHRERPARRARQARRDSLAPTPLLL